MFTAIARNVFIPVTLLFFLLGAPAYAGPLDAITSVQQGIDSRDISKVNSGLDMDTVLNSVFAEVLEQIQEMDMSKVQLPELVLAVVKDPNSTQSVLLKALLVQEIKNQINTGVTSGFFAGEVSTSGVGSLLQHLNIERITLKPEKVLSQTGDEAIISATLTTGKGSATPLELITRHENDTWRVKGIKNLKNLTTKALSGK